MRATLLVLVAILVALAASEVLDASLFNISRSTTGNNTVTVKDHSLRADDNLWESAHCRGSKLFLGMMLDAPEAATVCQPVISQFDGTLERELMTWGYADFSESPGRVDDCEMADGFGGYGLGPALRDIGADGRGFKRGGDNVCYMFEHLDGPAIIRDKNGDLPDLYDPGQYYNVQGTRYRATGAIFSMGVNARSGIVYFINRLSPATEARSNWNVPSVRPEELPQLRASSDIAWGIWRRKSDDLANINYFFSIDVVNSDTSLIIARAAYERGYDYIPTWPGLSFRAEDQEKAFTALLGSPNCLGAGWFLIQHKVQMGQNRYIHRINIFTRTGHEQDLPQMLIQVKQAPLPAPFPPTPFPPPVFEPGQPPPPSQNEKRGLEFTSPAKSPYPRQESGAMEGVEPVGPPTQDKLDLVRKHIIWG